jgi:hypothetical protein
MQRVLGRGKATLFTGMLISAQFLDLELLSRKLMILRVYNWEDSRRKSLARLPEKAVAVGLQSIRLMGMG